MSSDPLFRLYTYFRSSCSARVRIACNLKNIPVEYAYINLLKGDHISGSYKQINPSQNVPSVIPLRSEELIVAGVDGTLQRPLTQSIAILEYLEEALPNHLPHLLPPIRTPADVDLRAQIRALAHILSCDLQPVTNMRTLNRVRKLAPADENDDATALSWANGYTVQIFTAYEEIVQRTAGKYCVGDEVTMADVCLLPAVWGSARWGVKLDDFPTIQRVFDNLSKLEAVEKAHWRNQEDTPEYLRSGAPLPAKS